MKHLLAQVPLLVLFLGLTALHWLPGAGAQQVPSGPGSNPWSLRRPRPSSPDTNQEQSSPAESQSLQESPVAFLEMDPALFPQLSLPNFDIPSPRNELPRTPGFGAVPYPTENLMILEGPWPESQVRVWLRDPQGREYAQTFLVDNQRLEFLELPLPYDDMYETPEDSFGSDSAETKGFQALAIPLYPHAHLPAGLWTLVWQRDQDPPGPEMTFTLRPRSFNLCSVPVPDPFTHPDMESSGYGQVFRFAPDSEIFLTLRLPQVQEAFHVGFYGLTGALDEYNADLHAPHRVFLLEGPWPAEERDRGWWQGQITLTRDDLENGLRIARSPGPDPAGMQLNIWDMIQLNEATSE